MIRIGSLRWRLVLQLIALQFAVSVLALGALIGGVWVFGKFVDESGEWTTEIIAQALDRAPDGGLASRPTPQAQWLWQAAPSLWLIARDAGGHELRRGAVPERYLSLVGELDGLERSALDLETGNARPRARFERLQTAAGSVNVLVQTGAPLSLWNKSKSAALVFLFLIAPMAVLSSLGFILAVPWVVRRGLRGLTAMAERAERIDVHQRTERLPPDPGTSETRPLVDAVNRAFDRLNAGYDRQERFLADAAHELRTPIATLRLQVEALPGNPARSELLRSSARLVTLAEQLLDLQRLAHTAAPRHPVDLKALSERVAADMAPLAILSHCSLAVDAPEAVLVPGDAASIERALSNLIQNAIEHGGAGCEIEVKVRAPACIDVSDSGPGIPEADREHVMEPFHRLRQQGRGAGLGLHLVGEVARLHGGSLSIASSALGGARMRLCLAASP